MRRSDVPHPPKKKRDEKTPDEVNDLPEHEVVVHEINIVTDKESVVEETNEHI